MSDQSGELQVQAYKNGKEWARETAKTADAPASLALAADRTEIRADGLDLSFVTIRVLDKAGVNIPRADDHIRFSIDSPCEIVATDNGDPTSPATCPRARSSGTARSIVLAACYGEHPRVTYLELDVGPTLYRQDALNAALFYDPRLRRPGRPLNPDTTGQRVMAEAIEPTLAKLTGDEPRVALGSMTDINTAVIPVGPLETDWGCMAGCYS